MAPNNTLPIHGNEKTMNLNHLLLTNVQASPYFKNNLWELNTYHSVLEEIYNKVWHLEPWEKGSRKTSGQTGMCGGVRGVGAGGIVSSAFCLLYKLYTMRLTRKQLVGLINHTDSPYIRGLGFLYIRFTQPPADFWDWYEPYLDDEEEVDVKAGGGCVMTIGAVTRSMLSKLEWWSTLFPRIPVPIQKKIEANLKERAARKIAEAELNQQVQQHLHQSDQPEPEARDEDNRDRSERSRSKRDDEDRHSSKRDDGDYRGQRDERRRSRSRSPRKRSRSRSRDRYRRSRSRDRHRRDGEGRRSDRDGERRHHDKEHRHRREDDERRHDRHSEKHSRRSEDREKERHEKRDRSRSRERKRSRSKERRDRHEKRRDSRERDRSDKERSRRETSYERDLKREKERHRHHKH